jgi:hypothetical protein
VTRADNRALARNFRATSEVQESHAEKGGCRVSSQVVSAPRPLSAVQRSSLFAEPSAPGSRMLRMREILCARTISRDRHACMDALYDSVAPSCFISSRGQKRWDPHRWCDRRAREKRC